MWSADALPDDDLVQQFELHPYVAAAAFRMMAGVPRDRRICPTDVSFTVDVENMIARWKAELGHDVDIRVCGTCMHEISRLKENINKFRSRTII